MFHTVIFILKIVNVIQWLSLIPFIIKNVIENPVWAIKIGLIVGSIIVVMVIVIFLTSKLEVVTINLQEQLKSVANSMKS
jgi:hypothetical protein